MYRIVLVAVALSISAVVLTACTLLPGSPTATPTATPLSTPVVGAPPPQPPGRLTVNLLPPGPPVRLNSAQCVVRAADGRTVQMAAAVGAPAPGAQPTPAAATTPAAKTTPTPVPTPTPNPLAAATDPARVNVVVTHRGQEITLDCQILMESAATPAPQPTPAAAQTPAPGQTPAATPAAKPRSGRTTADLNMRAEPSATATIITVIPNGQTVEIIGQREVAGTTWLNVRYNNQTGWVAGQFVAQ